MNILLALWKDAVFSFIFPYFAWQNRIKECILGHVLLEYGQIFFLQSLVLKIVAFSDIKKNI